MVSRGRKRTPIKKGHLGPFSLTRGLTDRDLRQGPGSFQTAGGALVMGPSRGRCPFVRTSLVLLDVAHDFTSLPKRLHHLLAFLPPADCVVALLEEIIQLVDPIHVFEQFSLHLVLGEPTPNGQQKRPRTAWWLYGTEIDGHHPDMVCHPPSQGKKKSEKIKIS